MRDGVIYVATGPEYLDLARASCESLKAHEPGLAADLFTDRPDLALGGPFDQVHPVPRVHDRAKLDCLPLTRFERTLFLDSDTLVLRAFGDLFDLLDRFECAIAHDVRRASDLIRAGQRETTPYAFPQMNSGVLLYRRSAAMWRFLAEWAARFHDSPDVRRDQVILKDLLWSSDLRFYVLPPEFNLRRVTMFDAWEPLDVLPTVLHSHRLMDHLRDRGAPRLRSLEDIVAAERVALAREWIAEGGALPEGWPEGLARVGEGETGDGRGAADSEATR